MTPSQQQVDRGTFKLVDGQWHKLCTGPGHEEPTYLPATEKYFYVRKTPRPGHPTGELVSRCRLCINWEKLKSPGSHGGWLEVSAVAPFYQEAVNRVGLMELSRRTGIGYSSLSQVVNREGRYVQKARFRLVMLELISMRRKGEHSVTNGARWKTEKRNNLGRDVCSGCGTPQSNYTEGCKTCLTRRQKREVAKKLN